MGDSFMMLSLDKEVSHIEQHDGREVRCDNIDINEMARHMLMNDQRVRMSPTNNRLTNDMTFSTKRKFSRGSDLTQHLPRSNPTTHRGYSSTKKGTDSPKQPPSRNQMVHQIYIQVNTSDNNMTFSGDSLPTHHQMVPRNNRETHRLDSLHSPIEGTPMVDPVYQQLQ